jgi:hypothetical protein
MAGRIQLTTRGVQDVYFTEDPDYSYFVQLFKKHTNYASNYVKLDIDNEAEFGKTIRLTIPKDQGDLLKTISLDVELAPIAGAETTRVGYVESIGHAMIEYIDMYIGDERVQRIPSDYLQIYSEQNYTQSRQNALNTLIGKYPDRTSDVPVSSAVILGHLGPATTTKKLFVDIPFYFYRNPELAVPLCAMCYQEVSIEIKFREISDCIVKTTDPTSTAIETVILDYELQSNVIITSNVVAVSRDGTTFALNSGGTETTFKRLLRGELTDTTTQPFSGIGEVSQGLNTVINVSGIHRYENGVWNTYNASDVNIDISNVQFSDDGDVIVQVGNGYWTWNETDYDFTSDTGVRNVSGDGSTIVKLTTDGLNFFVTAFSLTTQTQVANQLIGNFQDAQLSHDASKLIVNTNTPTLTVYERLNGEWVRYGQTIGVYEYDKVKFTKDGDAILVFNSNETYQEGTDSYEGVGRLYLYDINSLGWVEVYRYKSNEATFNGNFVAMNDDHTVLVIKKTDSVTEHIKIQEITRSVENYDDIVIKNLEDVTDTGGQVLGAGYQGLTTQQVDEYLLNENSSYRRLMNQDQLLVYNDIQDIVLSDDGLVMIGYVNNSNALIVYKRNSVYDLFPGDYKIVINNSSTRFLLNTETISSLAVSKNGTYFSLVTTNSGTTNVYVFKFLGNRFVNIFYVDSDNDNARNVIHSHSFQDDTRVLFSEDETKVTIYGRGIITYDLSNPSSVLLSNTLVEYSNVYDVSLDLNRLATYNSTTTILTIQNIDENYNLTKSGLNINISDVNKISFSTDGTIMGVATPTYTYIYSYDGFGWKQKSLLFPVLGGTTLKRFILSSDGNAIAYVSEQNSAPFGTVIRKYVYTGSEWERFLFTSAADNTGGVGDINKSMINYVNVLNGPTNDTIRVSTLRTQKVTETVTVDSDIKELYPNQINSCKVCLEMAFLDDHERNLLRRTRKDYVITQVQHNTFNIPKSIEEHKFRLDFINPVKELYFVIKRENLRQYEDFVSVFDYDNDALIAENKLIFYENLKSLELTLNDTPYLDEYTGNFIFLKAIQPAIHHSKTPLIRRFYTYSFSCEPEKHYPTGQVNFSLINNQLIKMKVTENTTKDRILDAYALSYNVLRVDKGMARVLFNTK